MEYLIQMQLPPGSTELSAHIHGPANRGQSGAIIQMLMTGSTKADVVALTQLRVDFLMNNILYVNVHTAAYPNGEIRGQIERVITSSSSSSSSAAASSSSANGGGSSASVCSPVVCPQTLADGCSQVTPPTMVNGCQMDCGTIACSSSSSSSSANIAVTVTGPSGNTPYGTDAIIGLNMHNNGGTGSVAFGFSGSLTYSMSGQEGFVCLQNCLGNLTPGANSTVTFAVHLPTAPTPCVPVDYAITFEVRTCNNLGQMSEALPHTTTIHAVCPGASSASTLSSTASTAVCGNHIVEAGEECDDGNTVDGDGCFSNCTTMLPPTTLAFGSPIRDFFSHLFAFLIEIF